MKVEWPNRSQETAERIAFVLDSSALHASLADPLLESINFLNEVVDRYPSAISFAPGAPYDGFLGELDISAYVERYREYLGTTKGMSLAAINRHLYQYGPSQGVINGLVAEALRRDVGVDVPDDAIVMTVGCQEAMFLAIRGLCATPQDVLAVIQPCFVGITGAARVLNVQVVAIDEKNGDVDFAQLERESQILKTEGKRIRALYVAPDFSNPSGTILSVSTRERLLEVAEREGFVIFEDGAYAFTVPTLETLPALKALDSKKQVVYLGTFAKLCMPGARVGFLIADQEIQDRSGERSKLATAFATIKSMVTVNTSPICQAIIGGMLLVHDCSFASLGKQKGLHYRNNLQLLLATLNDHLKERSHFPYRVSWNSPRGGFFVRMRLPTNVDGRLLDMAAREYGVLWTPMINFYLNRLHCDEIRLSCSNLSAGQIEEGVRRLALFLKDPRVQ